MNPAAFLRVDWDAPARVRALATLRHGGGEGASLPPFDRFNLGAACGDAPEAVQSNRRALIRMADLPAEPRWLQQVHGTAVARFDAGSTAAPIQADAAVTSTPGVVLAILTADCLPVLFSGHDGTEVAAAHAGWRGLAAGVLEATVAALRCDPQRIHAWLGPAAGPAAYEVGEEVRAAFIDRQAAAASAFLPTRPGHWLCDLYSLARMRLRSLGVARIDGGGHCTIGDRERFYSHRRDGRSGRMASLVWIAPESA